VLARLGGDVVQAHRLAPAFCIRIDAWKPAKCSGGASCLAPEGYNPVKNVHGDLELIDEKGTVIAKMPEGGYYFDVVDHPYGHVVSMQDIDGIPISEITDEELAFIENEVRDLYDNTDKAILLSYYRWRQKYGGMNTAAAKRLRELEKENSRLKRLVADLSLDNAILKDVTRGNF
jgi:hypothetical protein